MARNEWPKEWGVARLEELVVLHDDGIWGPEAQADHGFLILRSTNMRGGKLSFEDVAYRDVPPKRALKYVLADGDILVTKSSGSPHLVGMPVLFRTPNDGKEYLFSNFTHRIRVDQQRLLPDFAVWYLLSPLGRHVLEEMHRTTTGLRNLDIQAYMAQEFPLPSLDEQRRIVARIEELTRRIEEAKWLRQTAHQEAATVMPAALAEVFGRAEQEGWETQRLDWVTNINMGQSPPGSSYNDRGDGLPLINGPTEFGPHHPTPAQWTTQLTKTCRPGDILICVRGATTGRMNWADQVYCIGRGLAALTVDELVCLPGYVYAFVQTQTQEILARSAGSTFPNLRSEELKALKIPIPPFSEQRRIVTYLDGLQARVEALRRLQEETEAEIAAMSGAVLAKAFRGEL